MNQQVVRRAGRPKIPVLSRQRIIETALSLLDEHGVTGLTIREVARKLNVRPSALYNHIHGREDLINGIREVIGELIDVTCFETMSWDAGILHWATSYRDAFLTHPQSVQLLATSPISSDSQINLMYEAVVRALTQAGWNESQVLSVIVAVESFVLGSVLDASVGTDILNPGTRNDVPLFSSAYHARNKQLSAQRRTPADATFEFGLSILVQGLRQEFSTPTAGPR